MKFIEECKARRQKRRQLCDDLEEEMEETFIEETSDDLVIAAILVGSLNTKQALRKKSVLDINNSSIYTSENFVLFLA